MPDTFGPTYEVTHTLGRDLVADFDEWLGQHIEEMLAIPGISRASVYAADDDEEGRPKRITLYQFDSDEDLENYLAGPARAMRQSATDLFGDRFTVSRRILRQSTVVDSEISTAEMCRNCGTTLTGQYCGNCGQRAHSRLISIWELLRDAFGDLLEFDSRLWRTLIPLTIRPGKLTRDYLEGRRARFMPPFRTYLVLSIVFFLIAFFDPREEFSIFFDADEQTAAEEQAQEQRDANEIRDEVMRELEAEGIIPARETGVDEENTGADPGSNNTAESDGEDGIAEENRRVSVNFSDTEANTVDQCDEIETDDLPPWITSWLSAQQLKVICERVVADDGQALGSKLADSIPAALIALLPLMAFVLKALYPLSKRYYVEHVLFVVHYHAFVFLILSLQILFVRITTGLGLPDGISAITTVAVSLYIPIYLYKAMRRVYEQSWFLTALKYLALVIAYLVGVMAILAITAAFAAFSI